MQGGIFRCSGSCSGKDALHSVGLLPRQVEVRAAEVAIGCDLLVDRTPKVQTADDRRRAQVKALADQLTQAGVGQDGVGDGHQDAEVIALVAQQVVIDVVADPALDLLGHDGDNLRVK